MAKIRIKIEGMRELQKSLDKLGKTPQKHVTSSAKKGMNIALKSAKDNAPYETGALHEGIIMKGETAKAKGKKVYRIVFDRNMNDIFQSKGKTYVAKSSKTKKKERGERVKNTENRVTGYYPISQEYGFFARDGRYIHGLAFTRNALEKNANAIEKTIVVTMKKKIDDEIAKGGLK